MNKYILVLTTLVLLPACGGDLGSGKHVVGPAEVIEIGHCNAESFVKCAVKVKWLGSGYVENGITYSSSYIPMIGDYVYRECWKDDGRRRCFSTLDSSPRNMYKQGGVFEQ